MVFRTGRTPLLPFLLLAALVVGCGEAVSFLPGNIAGDLLILPAPGSVLSPGFPIRPVVANGDETPDTFDARLIGTDGSVISLEIEEFDLPADADGLALGANIAVPSPVWVIPEDIPPGLWTLEIAVWSGETLLDEGSSPIYLAAERYVIEGVDIYPPESAPGGVVIIQAQFHQSDAANPMLRWILDDRVISEGPYRDGFDRLTTRVPEGTGVFPLVLELRPFPGGEEHPAPREYRTEVFVTETLQDTPEELAPPESYLSLLHFRGELGEHGQAGEMTGNPEIKGSPLPTLEEGLFGFRFDGDDYLIWPDWILPAADNEWRPFTITTRILPNPGLSGMFFAADDGSGSRFVLSFGEDDTVIAEYGSYSGSFLSRASLPAGAFRPYWLSLTVRRDGENLSLRWAIDGVTAGKDVWLNPGPPRPGGGAVSTLGGSPDAEGFQGFIEEWGVYTVDTLGSPSADGGHFEFVQKSIWGRRLVTAEGFDDHEMDGSWKVGEKVTITGGDLVIPPGETVIFALPDHVGEAHRLRWDFSVIPDGSSGILSMRFGADGEPFALFDTGGGVLFPDLGAVTKPTGYRGTWDIVVDRTNESSVRREVGGIMVEKAIPMPDNEGEVFYEFTTSVKNEADLRLDHILVTRE